MKMFEKEFYIPIQDKERCEELNSKFGTDYKSTEESLDEVFEEMWELIMNCGDEGGWDIGDDIKIKLTVEYEPENK